MLRRARLARDIRMRLSADGQLLMWLPRRMAEKAIRLEDLVLCMAIGKGRDPHEAVANAGVSARSDDEVELQLSWLLEGGVLRRPTASKHELALQLLSTAIGACSGAIGALRAGVLASYELIVEYRRRTSLEARAAHALALDVDWDSEPRMGPGPSTDIKISSPRRNVSDRNAPSADVPSHVYPLT